MTKRVLNVGQCAADHPAITRFLKSHFDVDVARGHRKADSLDQLRKAPFDLVLVNRQLDADGTEGLAVVQAIKTDPELNQTPVMLVSNYAEAQQSAMAAGAEQGFGKSDLDTPEVIERLRAHLE